MSKLTGKNVLDRVQAKLLDESGNFWTRAELLDHLAASFNAIVAIKPDAFTVTRRVRVEKGTYQAIPSDGSVFIEAKRNLTGDKGDKPGKAIRYAQMDVMNRTDPDWHTKPASDVIRCYLHDPRDPKVWYCFPPMKPSGSWVEIIYAAAPERYVDEDQPVPLDDIYEDAMYNFVLSEAYGKNSKRSDATKSVMYLNKFRAFMGGREIATPKVEEGRPEKEAS